MTALNLTISQGEPLEAQATVTDGAARWDSGLQVYGEIRPEAGSDILILDLRPYLTAVNVGADTVVTLAVPGSVTRGLNAGGRYDVFVSEPGAAQAKALRVMRGAVNLDESVTVGP